jgi:hypothetical protein
VGDVADDRRVDVGVLANAILDIDAHHKANPLPVVVRVAIPTAGSRIEDGVLGTKVAPDGSLEASVLVHVVRVEASVELFDGGHGSSS